MIMGISIPEMPDLLGDEKFLFDRSVGGASLEQFKYTGQLCAAHAPALTKA